MTNSSRRPQGEVEPDAAKVARPVLRGPGSQQCEPGYPTLLPSSPDLPSRGNRRAQSYRPANSAFTDDRSGSDRDTPPVSALAGTAAALLGSLGLSSTQARDDVEHTCQLWLDERGHTAQVAEMRYGQIILDVDRDGARWLRFDLDVLRGELERSHPGEVARIVIHTV